MVHLPTVARFVTKSVRYPARAARGALEVVRLSRMDLDAERQKLLTFLSQKLDSNAAELAQEYRQSDFAGWINARREALANFPGPYRFGSTTEPDCESLYFLVRALKPALVVETGVCYGASSAYILEALAHNGVGELYSIDLGNTPEEPPNDFFVPRTVLDRWHLIIGDSKQELPALLKRLGHIDLFHHDSLHTYDHMMWEYETAFPYIREGGALSSHDVNAVLSLRRPFRRSPFNVFCEQRGWRVQTAYNFGVALDDSATAAAARWQAPAMSAKQGLVTGRDLQSQCEQERSRKKGRA